MKPRSKSEWMTPAATGAVSPAWIVQARTSFSPAVKYVRSPSSRYVARMSAPMPLSATPMWSRNSFASSGERSTRSLSSCALTTTASQARWVFTYSRTSRTHGFDSASAISDSSTLQAKMVRLSLSRKNPLARSRSASSSSATSAGRPAASAASSFASTASSAAASLSPRLTSLAIFSRRRCTVSRSASINSVLTTSMSRTGWTSPSTWWMS